MRGWVKLHRKLLESSVFDDPQILKLWVWCLLKASHNPTTVLVEKQEVSLEPGQFVTGRYALADEYNRGLPKSKKVSPVSLWRWLKKLEKWEKVNIKTTSKYSVVTVLNWGDYQQDEQQVNNKWSADEQQVNTNKNGKNDKKIPIESKVLDLFTEILGDKLPKPVKLTSKRKSLINARLRDLKTMEGFEKYFRKVRKCPWLLGDHPEQKRKWRADFDWLLTESNFVRVQEGKYDPPEAQRQKVRHLYY